LVVDLLEQVVVEQQLQEHQEIQLLQMEAQEVQEHPIRLQDQM
jgi:hypothetical protein